MSWDKRASHRIAYESGLNVRIRSIDGTQTHACVLKDISKTGAKLAIEEPFQPSEFHESILLLSPDDVVQRHCELVRSDQCDLGVRFLKKRKNK
jgi:hypothetical protein